MANWLAYTHQNQAGFGQLVGDAIQVHTGNLFQNPQPSGATLKLTEVEVTLPCQPSKLIGLWNNYHAQAAKQNLSIPAEPLYFIKAASSYLAHGQAISPPAHYDGRVVYEGELGIVIGQVCKNADETQAQQAIFGYTIINDVTALDLLNKDASFAQWTRAKSFDTFGVFGPCIATDLDWASLTVQTLINGRERQNYPCSDMIFSPAQIVSHISKEMRLIPGDIIACGTSLGVLPMKAGTVVEVVINGIGTLRNTFGNQTA